MSCEKSMLWRTRAATRACRSGRFPTRGTTRELTFIVNKNFHSKCTTIHSRIIAKGASGGLGSGGVGSSRGSVAVAVLELHKHEELYFLVGQQGENALCVYLQNRRYSTAMLSMCLVSFISFQLVLLQFFFVD